MNSDPYSLEQLHDIIEPAAISPWPPAAGFWFLLALLLLWLSAIALTLWQRHRRNRYRRLAVAQLQALSSQLDKGDQPSHVIAAIGELLKRTALVAYPRQQVASLSGSDWLQFLNHSAATDAFSSDTARLLTHSAYQRAQPPPSGRQTRAIIDAAHHWIDHHHPQQCGSSPC